MSTLTYTENYGSVIPKGIKTGIQYDIQESVNKGNEQGMPQLKKISFKVLGADWQAGQAAAVVKRIMEENKDVWIINIFIRIVGYQRDHLSNCEGIYEISLIDNYGLVHREPLHGIQRTAYYDSGNLVFTNFSFNNSRYKDLEPLPDQFIDIIKSNNLYTGYPNNFNKIFSDLKPFLNVKEIEELEDSKGYDHTFLTDLHDDDPESGEGNGLGEFIKSGTAESQKSVSGLQGGSTRRKINKKIALHGGKKTKKNKRKHKNKKTHKNKRKHKK